MPSACFGAAGMGIVIVETVGVGQMEVDIASASDTTVVVVTPGWGDSMQASKAGLLEVADVFVINKADRPGVREARRDLEQMLDLSRPERLAAGDRRDDGDGSRGGGRALARRGAPPRPPGALGRAGGPPHRACGSGAAPGAAGPHRGPVDELTAGEEFTTAVKALAAAELDPYEAADGLLAG